MAPTFWQWPRETSTSPQPQCPFASVCWLETRAQVKVSAQVVLVLPALHPQTGSWGAGQFCGMSSPWGSSVCCLSLRIQTCPGLETKLDLQLHTWSAGQTIRELGAYFKPWFLLRIKQPFIWRKTNRIKYIEYLYRYMYFKSARVGGGKLFTIQMLNSRKRLNYETSTHRSHLCDYEDYASYKKINEY